MYPLPVCAFVSDIDFHSSFTPFFVSVQEFILPSRQNAKWFWKDTCFDLAGLIVLHWLWLVKYWTGWPKRGQGIVEGWLSFPFLWLNPLTGLSSCHRISAISAKTIECTKKSHFLLWTIEKFLMPLYLCPSHHSCFIIKPSEMTNAAVINHLSDWFGTPS